MTLQTFSAAQHLPRRSRPWRTCISAVVALVAVSAHARAQTPSATHANPTGAPSNPAAATTSSAAPPTADTLEARAETLFRSGEEKFDAGLHLAACADFEESLHLGPKLGTLLNLALCHETVGRLATAWAEFHHAAAWAAQNGSKDKIRHDFARAHALALEARLPRVVLQLPHLALAGVDVDGEPLPEPRWYLPLYVDPGVHSIAISAPGKQRTTVTFRVTEEAGDQIVLVPMPDDLPSKRVTRPKRPTPIDEGLRRRRIAGLTTASAGVAALGVSAVFGVLAIEARDEIGSHCAANICDPQGAAQYRDAQGLATISTISAVAGLAAIGAGAYFLATSGPWGSGRFGLSPRAGGAELGFGGAF